LAITLYPYHSISHPFLHQKDIERGDFSWDIDLTSQKLILEYNFFFKNIHSFKNFQKSNPSTPLKKFATKGKDLWKSTCFELFYRPIRNKNLSTSTNYYEMNFSTNDQFEFFHYTSYRKLGSRTGNRNDIGDLNKSKEERDYFFSPNSIQTSCKQREESLQIHYHCLLNYSSNNKTFFDFCNQYEFFPAVILEFEKKEGLQSSYWCSTPSDKWFCSQTSIQHNLDFHWQNHRYFSIKSNECSSHTLF
jgi:hypothetical protein